MARKRPSQKSGPSQRQLRVGEELRHALSTVLLREACFMPELSGLSITVSEVSISPDMSSARVYVMPLAGQDQDAVLTLLNEYAPALSKEVARIVYLKRMPRLKFKLDDSFDEADKMGRLFQKLQPAPVDLEADLEPDLETEADLAQSDLGDHITSENDTKR